MSRVSPLRLCSTAGLTLGIAAAGVAFAPAAFAAGDFLPPLEGDTIAVVDEVHTLSGTECLAPDGAEATVYVDYYTAADWEDGGDATLSPEPGLAAEDGTWIAEATFTAAAPLSEYVVAATCEPYSGAPDDKLLFYPEFTFTLEAAPAAPTATPTVAPTGAVRGTAANTPGVASPDGGAATGDSAAPGKKVVKVLTGFKPHEVVTVTLHSTPQTVGTFTADAHGTVRVEFTVPAGTPTGTHTLVYEGSMGTYFQEAFAETAAAGTGTGSGSGLAYTGASVALPLGLGTGALALGGGLVFLTRRRNAQAAEGMQA